MTMSSGLISDVLYDAGTGLWNFASAVVIVAAVQIALDVISTSYDSALRMSVDARRLDALFVRLGQSDPDRGRNPRPLFRFHPELDQTFILQRRPIPFVQSAHAERSHLLAKRAQPLRRAVAAVVLTQGCERCIRSLAQATRC